MGGLVQLVQSIPGFAWFGKKRLDDWVMETDSIEIGHLGNVAALGGFKEKGIEEVSSDAEKP